MTWNAAVYCTPVDPDTVMVRCAAPWFSPVLWRKRHIAEAEAAARHGSVVALAKATSLLPAEFASHNLPLRA